MTRKSKATVEPKNPCMQCRKAEREAGFMTCAACWKETHQMFFGGA